MNWVLPPKLFIAGALSALAFMLLFPIIDQFALFAALFPLFNIILTHPSNKECQIVIILAWFMVLIASGLYVGTIYLLCVAGPSFIVSQQYFRSYKIRQKKIWFSSGQLFTDLLIWNMMSVVVIYLILPQSVLRLDITNTFTQISQDPLYPKYKATIDMMRQYIDYSIYYRYAMNLILSIFLTIFAFGKIQKITVKNKINRRPAVKFAYAELPKWYWGCFVMSSYLWVMLTPGSAIALINANIFMIILSGFFLQGLSIVHNVTENIKNKQMILVIFYLVMILFTLLILLVTLLGILEPWLQVRQRFSIRKE